MTRLQDLTDRGIAARETLPRSELGIFHAVDRDPISILEDQHRSRLAELVPVRVGRMLQSPFTFYRGSAAIMMTDLAKQPCTGTQVIVCGDAHLTNYGLYASPERRLVFDLNDFDEATNAPWEWDIKRLATSALIA